MTIGWAMGGAILGLAGSAVGEMGIPSILLTSLGRPASRFCRASRAAARISSGSSMDSSLGSGEVVLSYQGISSSKARESSSSGAEDLVAHSQRVGSSFESSSL